MRVKNKLMYHLQCSEVDLCGGQKESRGKLN